MHEYRVQTEGGQFLGFWALQMQAVSGDVIEDGDGTLWRVLFKRMTAGSTLRPKLIVRKHY